MKKRAKKQMKDGRTFVWKSILFLGLFITLCSFAQGRKEQVGGGLLAVILVALLLPLLGFSLGAFGFITNHIFRKRTAMAYQVLQIKPGLSFLMGSIITVIGLGLIAIFHPFPRIQCLILAAYILGLLLFAAGAMVRLVARFMEPAVLADDLPGPWSHIKAGIFLLALHLILFLGSVLFFGILLACVGATLLSFFASMGKTITQAEGK